MKKILQTVFICAIIATFPETSFAQKLSFGEYSGINFSNLHGNLTSNKWMPKPGPTAGFLVEYKLNKSFTLQSEIGFLTNYYEMKTYEYQNPDIIYYNDYYKPASSTLTITDPYPQKYDWNFSFLRVPLLIKYQTPTRLQFGVGGGLFYSFLLNDDLTKKEREAAKKEDRNIYPPTYDWGYLLSADLSYPVTKDLKVFIAGRISTGQKVFIENYKAKNGASEFFFGLKLTPQWNKSITQEIFSAVYDSLPSKIYIKPRAGITYSWNATGGKLGNYKGNVGSNAGTIIGYRLDRTVSIQSGVQLVRKGYALADSSIYNFRYGYSATIPVYEVDSKVSLDYLTIPLNFNFSFGNRVSFYMDLGAYAGFLVNATCHGTVIRKYLSEYSYRIEKINLNDAVEGYFKTMDWGYLVGTGIQFPFRNNLKFDMGINYSGSISELLKKPDANSYVSKEDLSVKNGSLSVQFGLQIPISR